MQRTPFSARPHWQQRAQELGFSFHSANGQPYWDESAAYLFTLKEIEEDLEAATEELAALCYEAVPRILSSEEWMEKLAIPHSAWDFIAASWRNQDKDLYGRFDLRYDGTAPAKLYEYNADTPTGLFEASVFQWHWLEDLRTTGGLPAGTDQFNSIHERLIDGFQQIGQPGSLFHFACSRDHEEDRATVAYLEDCAQQAGLSTIFLFMDEIGLNEDGHFADLEERAITRLFKLYPWEWLLAEPFAPSLAKSGAIFVEPAWKLLLSNKGLLVALWSFFPDHPHLLPAYFEEDPRALHLGEAYARKPLFGREGANIELVDPTAAPVENASRPLWRAALYPPGSGSPARFFRPASRNRRLVGRGGRRRDRHSRKPGFDHRQ